jgi:folate-binding protein YgfZ
LTGVSLGNLPAVTTAPFAAWIERDVVQAAGDDAVAFLQGQLAQDVAALAIGRSAWSLLLEPSGKVTAWVRATRVGATELVLDTDPGAGQLVVQRLQRFKLRTKCDLELSEATAALAVRGVALPAEGAGLPIAWPGVEGFDQLGPSGSPPAGVALVDAAAYEAARIEAGVPVSGVDITTDTIPAEAGQWLVDASVSFTKGCYTGQELVARIDSRGGNVPKPLRVLAIDGEIGQAAVGMEVSDGAKVVGRVTSAAWSPAREATVALGPVGRTVDAGASLVVGGHPARLTVAAP